MNVDTAASAADRPLRADARRNREKILEAAKLAFGETGLHAQMDDVAARAGVGVGTVYRHFPTKEALVRALIVDHMHGMAEIGHEMLDDTALDPWDAFSGFLWRCAEQKFVLDRTLSGVFSTAPASDFRQAAEDETDLRDVGAQLLSRAQADGAVRADARAEDIPVIMCGLAGVRESDWGPAAWRRYLTLALAGLRTHDGEPLPD
jgi:AcrR family transcriptional regulator